MEEKTVDYKEVEIKFYGNIIEEAFFSEYEKLCLCPHIQWSVSV